MYGALSQTIGAIKSRAVFQRRDISATPMGEFLAKMNSSSIKGQENIEEAAVSFYLSNHGFHLIEAQYGQSEILPKDVQERCLRHVEHTSKMALRMFFYILVISAEEAHFGEARNDRFHDFVESSTSKDAAAWLQKVMGSKLRGSGHLGAPADVGAATLGECVKALELCFRFAQWHHGFGGLPWAQITETAGEVVRGTNSLELMVDKAFTLCHNNGAIFNKGHQFTTYRSEFYTILDIQASGQIPAAIHSKVNVTGFAGASVKAMHQDFEAMFPQEFTMKYDPSKVKSMEQVRAKKTAAAAAKAHAYISGGGGFGGGAAPMGSAPPKRACDDLFTMDDLDAINAPKSPFSF